MTGPGKSLMSDRRKFFLSARFLFYISHRAKVHHKRAVMHLFFFFYNIDFSFLQYPIFLFYNIGFSFLSKIGEGARARAHSLFRQTPLTHLYPVARVYYQSIKLYLTLPVVPPTCRGG